MQNCITRITNGQETVKVLAHFVAIILFQILKVSKEFIINLDTVYNKPSSLFIKNLNRVYSISRFLCKEERMIAMNNWHLLFLFGK